MLTDSAKIAGVLSGAGCFSGNGITLKSFRGRRIVYLFSRSEKPRPDFFVRRKRANLDSRASDNTLRVTPAPQISIKQFIAYSDQQSSLLIGCHVKHL
jgi:hypothetical protein